MYPVHQLFVHRTTARLAFLVFVHPVLSKLPNLLNEMVYFTGTPEVRPMFNIGFTSPILVSTSRNTTAES